MNKFREQCFGEKKNNKVDLAFLQICLGYWNLKNIFFEAEDDDNK